MNWKSIKLNLHRLIDIKQDSHDKLDHSQKTMQPWLGWDGWVQYPNNLLD
jgi:hypothetical protein